MNALYNQTAGDVKKREAAEQSSLKCAMLVDLADARRHALGILGAMQFHALPK